MKILNKIISLTMAVIMMITATPVLQAADFINLDIQQLNEMKQEIKSSIKAKIDEVTPLFEGIPSVEILKQRYNTARENYEQNLKSFSKQETKQSKEDYERYIEFLKQEAQKRIETDSRYNGFMSEEEQKQVAFYTVLLEEMEKSDEERELYYSYIAGDICGGLIIGIILGYMAYDIGAGMTGILITGAIAGAISMFLMFLFASPSKQPVFNPALFPQELISDFLNNPFYKLALFNKRGVNDFGVFYIKSRDCAQVLYDAVDIEYYTSLNPSIENMCARLYTQTVDWHYLTTEQRGNYIHNLAERLRAEAN